MKDLSLLTWLTQLGISVAVPPAALILAAVWLRNHFGWGKWVIWVAIVLSIYCAVAGLLSSLRALSRMAGEKKHDSPVGFNEHE